MPVNIKSKEEGSAHSIESAVRANVIWGALGVIISLLGSMLLVRSLPAWLFAEYATSIAIMSFGVVIIEAGGASALSRYLREAEQLQARATFYKLLRRRRLLIGIMGLCVLAAIGPVYGNTTALPGLREGFLNWVLIATAAAVQLTGQLAYVGLQTLFEHKQALIVRTCASLARALLVVGAAALNHTLTSILVALVASFSFESYAYNRLLKVKISAETASLPVGFMERSIKYGGVTIADKVTVNLGFPNMLLLFWATIYSATDIAVLGLAIEITQRIISLAGLPLSGIIGPYLNSAEDGLDLRSKAGKLLFATGVVYSGLLTLCIPLMPIIIAILYGAARLPTAQLAQLVLISAVFDAFSRGTATFLLRLSKFRQLIAADIGIVLVIWLVSIATSSHGISMVVAVYAVTRSLLSLGWLISMHSIYEIGAVGAACKLFLIGVGVACLGALVTRTLTGVALFLGASSIALVGSGLLIGWLLFIPLGRRFVFAARHGAQGISVAE